MEERQRKLQFEVFMSSEFYQTVAAELEVPSGVLQAQQRPDVRSLLLLCLSLLLNNQKPIIIMMIYVY